MRLGDDLTPSLSSLEERGRPFMIRPKSGEEVEKMAVGGRILAEILQQLGREAVVGSVPAQLDSRAQELITERGVKPSFF